MAAHSIRTQSSSGKRQAYFMAPEVPKKTRVPRASDLLLTQSVTSIEPPTEVREKLGSSQLMIGVDIETHDWEERRGNQGSLGQFGFYSLCHPDDFNARIVQIGWTIGSHDHVLATKEHLVRPESFNISMKAAKYHGITHEKACAEGNPIDVVLQEFMQDILDVDQRGGRMVVHHLEFDCGIIARELERANSKYQKEWSRIARRGVCTMDPSIGRWLRACFGEEQSSNKKTNTMRLSKLVSKLLPGGDAQFGLPHTAGADSHRHLRLYFEMLKLAGVDHSAVERLHVS